MSRTSCRPLSAFRQENQNQSVRESLLVFSALYPVEPGKKTLSSLASKSFWQPGEVNLREFEYGCEATSEAKTNEKRSICREKEVIWEDSKGDLKLEMLAMIDRCVKKIVERISLFFKVL